VSEWWFWYPVLYYYYYKLSIIPSLETRNKHSSSHWLMNEEHQIYLWSADSEEICLTLLQDGGLALLACDPYSEEQVFNTSSMRSPLIVKVLQTHNCTC
jgi:hypothetical protein